MKHVLFIEDGSEAEVYFIQLMEITDSDFVEDIHFGMHDGILYNRYEFDDDTYTRISNYLKTKTKG